MATSYTIQYANAGNKKQTTQLNLSITNNKKRQNAISYFKKIKCLNITKYQLILHLSYIDIKNTISNYQIYHFHTSQVQISFCELLIKTNTNTRVSICAICICSICEQLKLRFNRFGLNIICHPFVHLCMPLVLHQSCKSNIQIRLKPDSC